MENEACALPACMPEKGPKYGSACHVAGWGQFNVSSKYRPDELHVAGINIFNREYCKDHATTPSSRRVNHKYYPFLDKSQFCGAGTIVQGGPDACKGDSGGPLICNVDGSAVLTGIVSWGINCGRSGSPGVYVDVNYLTNWVTEHSGIDAAMLTDDDICKTCDKTGFTYEETFTYGNADSFIGLADPEIGNYQDCAGKCDKEPDCTAYTWYGSTDKYNCYLLRTISLPPIVKRGAVTGRRCSLVPDCKGNVL